MVTRKKTVMIIMAFVVVLATAAGLNATADDIPGQAPVRPGHPPMPLQMWGLVAPDGEARTRLGLDRLSTPLNIPDDLELKSTRVLVTEDQSYRQMTQFYGPALIDTSDNVRFNDFLDNGGIMIVYVEDDHAERFNWEKLGPALVGEAAEKREMRTINEVDSFIVSGNRMQNEKSEVMFDIGRTRIDVISKAYDAATLIPIAQTIRD